MFTVHLIKILGTVIIFRLFCVNAKIIYAKFVTKEYNDLFKCENEKNNGMCRDAPQILLRQCFLKHPFIPPNHPTQGMF